MDTGRGYPLIVAQYSIRGHPTRTEHWRFIVILDKTNTEIHELRGNYDTFTYVHEKPDPSKRARPWTLSVNLCGGCLVGYIRAEQLPGLPDLLSQVTIIKHDRSFDSQNWIVSALWVLQEQGIVFKEMNERRLRQELEEEKEREQTGHDLVYDRIFSGELHEEERNLCGKS